MNPLKSRTSNKLSQFIQGVTLAVLWQWFACLNLSAQAAGPIQIVKQIAERVISETSFAYNLVPQKTVLDIQLVDFRKVFGGSAPAVGYALSCVETHKDTTVKVAVSNSDGIKIWVNDQQVFQKNQEQLTRFKEIAYNFFVFQDTFTVDLKKGVNRFLIKLASNRLEWQFLMRFVTAPGTDVLDLDFSLEPISTQLTESNWLCVGPFPNPQVNGNAGGFEVEYPPEIEIRDYYYFENSFFSWTFPERNVLPELDVPATNTYKRDSYLEWHYANGTTMFGMIALADQTGEDRYLNFVKRFYDFTLTHLDYFRWQYESLHSLRGTNHRLFRRTMLDDSSAPAVPLLEMYLRDARQKYRGLIDSIAEYVTNQQVRLDDGTFCRPEPQAGTVWADDLFMSVPFLLRMGKITGKQAYYDDVALQIGQFARRLFDNKRELFYHCWYKSSPNTTIVKWGRANGWMIWAISEALTYLPKNHPGYEKILNIFQQHVAGLAKYQGDSGMWHQVLDHPQSFEETSCTAMFVLAMARGVRNGWLDKKYEKSALKGWQALTQKITSDGIVYGICRGTGVGTDLDFYLNRQTFPNDPRGLGAVIVAGVEMAKLTE